MGEKVVIEVVVEVVVVEAAKGVSADFLFFLGRDC